MLIRDIKISDETLKIIGAFAINWSAFEEKYCHYHASPNAIKRITIHLDEDEGEFNKAVDIFRSLLCTLLKKTRDRIDEEAIDYYLYNDVARARDNSYHDNVIIIRDFLQGTTNDFHAALLCIERIRNNFFHGTKDYYHLDKQKELFESACNVLYWLC